MSMQINKDTYIYGSFSSNPGNNGTVFFNSKFKELGINAIYKSFYSNDIKNSFEAAKVLGFKGFAISMPFKQEIIPLLDRVEPIAASIGAVNTVVLEKGEYVGYNTDWEAVREFLLEHTIKELTIAGNGGFSKAIQYACSSLNIKYEVLSREDINNGKPTNFPVFNATPVDLNCNYDGRPGKEAGKIIAKYQAEKQLILYVKEG